MTLPPSPHAGAPRGARVLRVACVLLFLGVAAFDLWRGDRMRAAGEAAFAALFAVTPFGAPPPAADTPLARWRAPLRLLIAGVALGFTLARIALELRRR